MEESPKMSIASYRSANPSAIAFAIWLAAFGASQSALGADIAVQPGNGTLAAAVSSASPGDTLVLADGAYFGAVTVNKSLTIRPVNRSTNARIGDALNIQGNGIRVTVQGLQFSADLSPVQAAEIRVLENEWLAGDFEGGSYRSSQGDGSLLIIGNRFASGSDILDVYTDGAYIAGNVLLGGMIETYAYAWIVGNQVMITDAPAISAGGSGATVNVIGNRVRCNDQNTADCVDIAAPSGLVAGNIVEMNDPYDGVSYTQNGIYADGTGHVDILNNVVRGLPALTDRYGSAIAVANPSARVAGNIVVDYVSASARLISVTSAIQDVTHNLCFNNSGSCPSGQGNQDANPRFVDLADYALGTGSPAINAGPEEPALADLDRTRNDMGAYGGPWAIGQYDSQRDPGTFAPYVYPLFKAGSPYAGGKLDLQGIGVARLR